jgi:hypothetical protein
MMEVEFTGELTGRRFRYDVMRPLEAAGQPGATLAGHHQSVDVESGESVYVRAVAGLTEFDSTTSVACGTRSASRGRRP